MDYDHCADEVDVGYTWLVYLDGPGSLKLATGYEKLKNLGGRRRGAEAALSVLREAVSAANRLLDDLDAYVATSNDVLGQLWNVAADHEAVEISAVARRAGLLWQCGLCAADMRADEDRCGGCGGSSRPPAS